VRHDNNSRASRANAFSLPLCLCGFLLFLSKHGQVKMTSATLTPELAGRFARVALGHVTREYPNKLDHVMNGPADVQSPRALHPVFYGSFDWHSCVHGYWLLANVYRRFPALPEAAGIRETFDAHLVPDKVAAEVAYLARPNSQVFQMRPYGWAWLLALATELARHTTAEGRAWHQALTPLARAFADRFRAFLPRLTYPIRVGTHYNSAFAVTLAMDYAEEAGDAGLGDLLRERARTWFLGDADCQAWEPAGDEFLSPALMEAECMQRVLEPGAFRIWFARFLPRLGEGQPATLFTPATVSDRSDGKIAHLDGLNLSRAWCLRRLALADGNGAEVLRRAAEQHLEVSMQHVSGDYMGEHWLATYALLALLG
jgi:hypothetical protein